MPLLLSARGVHRPRSAICRSNVPDGSRPTTVLVPWSLDPSRSWASWSLGFGN